MPNDQSPVVLDRIEDSRIRAFLAAVDEDRGWSAQVLSRLFREGKNEAGDIACDCALQTCIQHKLVQNIMDTGDHDYAYQLTDLGRLVCIHTQPNRYKNMKFKAGDMVTLDRIEYDNYYDLYKVIAVKGNHVAVALPKDWKRVESLDDLNSVRVYGLIVQLDEISHATWDEEQTNERSNNV